MAINVGSRLKRAWNAFTNRDPPGKNYYGGGSSYRPDRVRLNRANDRTIMTAIYTRIAMDAAGITINHVRLDENGRYDETVDSGLNCCLNLSGNKDQTGRALRYDMFLSVLDEGVAALVPVDVDVDEETGKEKILSMRVAKVKEWYPDDVRLEVYNDQTGQKEEITLPKAEVALIENPFYAVMNEPNGTIQRLIRKLNLMDVVDDQLGSEKLDLIIQLPYVVRNDIQKKRADDRRAEIERQLTGSKYGIAYTDGSEHITQLNRSLENNLLKTVEYLTNMAYSQLGITPEIMNGTASDAVMTNYENRNEMRYKLNRELALAYILGDGRMAASRDKIDENCIRPVFNDADLFTIKVQVKTTGLSTVEDKYKAFIKQAIRARKDYRGSGTPTMFTTEDALTEMLLLEDGMGRPLYTDEAALARKLRVAKIVTIPEMEGRKGAKGGDLAAVIVNLADYTVGADKGGAVSMFDDFDIDFNAQKYLIETRCSGALTSPYSAMAIEWAA